jgi:hypothetical protein
MAVIVIITSIIVFTFMQGIYNYVPEAVFLKYIMLQLFFVVTVCGKSNAFSRVKRFGLVHYCFPKYVRCAQYGCFL